MRSCIHNAIDPVMMWNVNSIFTLFAEGKLQYVHARQFQRVPELINIRRNVAQILGNEYIGIGSTTLPEGLE